MSLPTALRASAWLSVSLVLGMIAIFVTTGVGQDPLQFVHPPDEYARLLLRDPAALRATLGLDDLFLILYSTVFVLLAILVPGPLVRIGVGLLVVVGLLDLVENAHFLAMLAGAEAADPPGAVEIRVQVVESLVKFHVSYLGLALLGLGLPRERPSERVLAFLSVFVQLPVGVLIYVTPHDVAVPLVFVRFTYFVVALALVGWAFARSR